MVISHSSHNSRSPRIGFRALWVYLAASSLLLLPVHTQTQSEPVPGEFSEKFEELVTEARRAHEEAQKLEAALPTSMAGDRVAIQKQISTRQLRLLETAGEIVEELLRQEQAGADTSELRPRLEEAMQRSAVAMPAHLDKVEKELGDLSGLDRGLSGKELLDREDRRSERMTRLHVLTESYIDHLSSMESLGINVDSARTALGERLWYRAEANSGQIGLAQEMASSLASRLRQLPEDADLQAQASVIESRMANLATSLTRSVELMDELGLPTADYRRVLVESAGQISFTTLDSEVAAGLLQDWGGQISDWVEERLPGIAVSILLFLLILFVFWIIAGFARRVTRRAVQSSKLNFSQLLQDMITSTVAKLILVLGLLIGLAQLGFEIGPVLAGLGILGFVVGFALQDSLANFAAGVMILVYRPYDVEDLVEVSGAFGTVTAMSLVSTTVLTLDNQTLIVPNGKIWGDVIRNFTGQDVRRVDMVFGISYSDDIPKAEKVLESIVEANDMILDDPGPIIKLHNLGDSAVEFVVRPWAKTDDYWDVFWDVTREVKMRFDAEQISIPFPQRDVHVFKEE